MQWWRGPPPRRLLPEGRPPGLAGERTAASGSPTSSQPGACARPALPHREVVRRDRDGPAAAVLATAATSTPASRRYRGPHQRCGRAEAIDVHHAGRRGRRGDRGARRLARRGGQRHVAGPAQHLRRGHLRRLRRRRIPERPWLFANASVRFRVAGLPRRRDQLSQRPRALRPRVLPGRGERWRVSTSRRGPFLRGHLDGVRSVELAPS